MQAISNDKPKKQRKPLFESGYNDNYLSGIGQNHEKGFRNNYVKNTKVESPKLINKQISFFESKPDLVKRDLIHDSSQVMPYQRENYE